MELASERDGALDDRARKAFAALLTRIAGLLQDALSKGVERGEFHGDPEAAALHIVTVTRGLAVLERAFGDERQLRGIAADAVNLLLDSPSPRPARRLRAR